MRKEILRPPFIHSGTFKVIQVGPLEYSLVLGKNSYFLSYEELLIWFNNCGIETLLGEHFLDYVCNFEEADFDFETKLYWSDPRPIRILKVGELAPAQLKFTL